MLVFDCVFFFKQKTAYEMRISDWSSDVCSSDLLDDVSALADLERIRDLMDELENTEEMLRLIELTQGSEGVRIFIGSENTLFRRAGCSLIVAPLQNQQQRIVGAIGVIGPPRMN